MKRYPLKPCPNPTCDETKYLRFFAEDGEYYSYVYCLTCGMSGPWGKGATMRKDAAAAWNALPRRKAGQEKPI